MTILYKSFTKHSAKKQKQKYMDIWVEFIKNNDFLATGTLTRTLNSTVIKSYKFVIFFFQWLQA